MRVLVNAAAPGHAAGRIWDEGRANPVDWIVMTSLGPFASTDRVTWRSEDGLYSAELRRSRNDRHVYLAMFEGGSYLGRYDADGWRAASTRSRIRHLRSSQLPLRLVA
jgi:hypothetical protein